MGEKKERKKKKKKEKKKSVFRSNIHTACNIFVYSHL